MAKWFERFEWDENPFRIQPDPDHIVGFVDMRARIMSYIDSHDPFLIIGPTGAGKTTLLLWVAEQDDRDVRYAYHNFLEEESDKKLRKKIKGGLLERLLGGRPVVALLDEVQAMKPETARWLRAQFDNGRIQSLVMAAMEDKLPNLEKPLLSRIGERKIYVRNLDEREAFQIVRQRVFDKGQHNPFDEEALKIVFNHADYAPRKILEACERLCIEAASQERSRIDADFASMVLKPHEPTKDNVKKAITSPPGGEIKKLVRDRIKNIMSSEPNLGEDEEASGGDESEKLPSIKERTQTRDQASADSKREGTELPIDALSPTQQRIVEALREKDMSTAELAEAIGVSRASAAKQLSRLALNTDAEILHSKGIEEPVVVQKETGRPVIYGLNDTYST